MSVLATQATEIFPLVIALKALFATLAPLNGKATERKEFFSPGQCLLHLWCNENCKVVARTIAWCNRFSKMPLTFSIYSNIKDTDIFVLGIKSWRQNKIYIYCWAVSRGKLICFVVFFLPIESLTDFSLPKPPMDNEGATHKYHTDIKN